MPLISIAIHSSTPYPATQRIMTSTSSMQRLRLLMLCLLAAAVPCVAEQVDLTSYDCGQLLGTRQDRLEGIRSAFSKLKVVRATVMDPVSEGGMDLELPSMLALTKEPASYFLTGWWLPLTSTQAIRQFQFNPWGHSGWIMLADVQPPLVTTEYHKVVIRMLRAYDAWKGEADSHLLHSLNGSGDPGFLVVIEWEMARAGR